MLFRVGHDVRFEIVIDAPNAEAAQELAEARPYGEWELRYVTMEDCVPIDESPINPNPAI